MKNVWKPVFVSAGALGLLVALLVPNRAQRAHAATPGKDTRQQIQQINQHALAVQKGDLAEVPELVDSVLESHGITREALGASGPRDQIVKAERDYHQGLRRGVTEADVARAINRLAVRFNTPAYTHTSAEEIRELRVQMLLIHPQLIGVEPAANRHRIPYKVLTEEMSPLEAVHVGATMLFQKMNNPEWQQTGEERAARWETTHRGSYKPNFSDQSRSQEVQQAVEKARSQMTAADALAALHETFSILGIGGDQQ